MSDELGSLGSANAERGYRYLPGRRVLHRTYEWRADPLRYTHCGLSAPDRAWLGTGSQDEYENLATLPMCRNCR